MNAMNDLKSEISAKYPPYKSAGWRRFFNAEGVTECSQTVNWLSEQNGRQFPSSYTIYYVLANHRGRQYLKYWGKRKPSEDTLPVGFWFVALAFGATAWAAVIFSMVKK